MDGTATANDTATVTIEDRSYTYTVQSGDTLDSIRDALVNLINQDPKVTAEASGVFDRILLRARVQGPEGNGIAVRRDRQLHRDRDHDGDRQRAVLRQRGRQPGDAEQSRRCPARSIIVYATGPGPAGAQRHQQGLPDDRPAMAARMDR